jgi:FkbM family methyltransferase
MRADLKALYRAIRRHRSPYTATLPYNLNWLNRDWSGIDQQLKTHPIRVIDIGARGESLLELECLRKYIEYFGFDADPDAELPTGYARQTIISQFVGTLDGTIPFNIFNSPGESSALKPNPAYRKFSPGFNIAKTIEVRSTTLDSLYSAGVITDADIIKLDTQGTEYEILAHAMNLVSKAFLIETEVEVFPMYEGQKLFHHVSDLLYHHGFILVYLNRVFASQASCKVRSRGQMIFADALFALSPERAHFLPLPKKFKLVVCLIQYGLLDYAQELFETDKTLKNFAPQLAKAFTLQKRRRFRVATWIDKLVLLLLFWRQTNHLAWDSDRSWPIR